MWYSWGTQKWDLRYFFILGNEVKLKISNRLNKAKDQPMDYLISRAESLETMILVGSYLFAISHGHKFMLSMKWTVENSAKGALWSLNPRWASCVVFPKEGAT